MYRLEVKKLENMEKWTLLDEYISLEMTRALTGAIGITITIPIAIYTTLLIYKRRANNDKTIIPNIVNPFITNRL
jgi:uncharacterized membrane protein